MRIDKLHEVWTDGVQIGIIWNNGHLCIYRFEAGATGPDLAGWLGPDRSDNPDWRGCPPAALGDRWCELTEWPKGAAEAAGDWSLSEAADAHLRLAGPGKNSRPTAKALDVGLGQAAAAELPDDASLVSRRATLVPSAHGSLLLDPELGLVWSLDAGVLFQLHGLSRPGSLSGVRVANGVILHVTGADRLGKLLHITDDGTQTEIATTVGEGGPLHLAHGAVWGLLPREGSWRGLQGTGLDTGSTGQQFKRIDAVSLEVTDALDTSFDMEPAATSSACVGNVWVVCNGQRAAVLKRVDGAWQTAFELKRPDGDPYDLAGRTRLAPAKTFRWSGPPGPFRAEGTIRNIGENRVGANFHVRRSNTMQITHIQFGDERATVRDGIANFARTAMKYEHAVPVVIEGRASSPDAMIVMVAALPKYRAKKPVELGRITVEVEVEGGLVAVRGDERLSILPEWTAALGRGGALDGSIDAPDLSRWLHRAMARCRVSKAEEDREGVLAEWRRMTERDRQATSVKMPAYKLSSGLHWMVIPAETKRIVKVLGTDHPLGAFAAKGPFEVQGTDPLEQ